MSELFKSFTRVQPVSISLPYDEDLYKSLLNEFQILHLLYHRNSNQHRVAKWWSYINIIHRHLRKILLLMEDINEVKTYRRLSIVKWSNPKKSNIKINEIPKISIKKKFIRKEKNKNGKTIKIEKIIKLHNQLNDADSKSHINKKLTLLIKESKYLYKNILPNSYWIFMGIIELAQFINVGFTIIGLISKIWNLLSKIEGIEFNSKFGKIINYQMEMINKIENNNDTVTTSDTKDHNDDGDDDFGEIVDVKNVEDIESIPITKSTTIEDIFGDLSDEPKKKKKKSSKKSSKKKSKNAMDDIFGF